MDLVGMTNRDNRARRMITMITKADGHWSQRECGRIQAAIRNSISGSPLHPNVLALNGEHAREVVAAAISHDNFELKVIQGLDNPDLPFTPQLI